MLDTLRRRLILSQVLPDLVLVPLLGLVLVYIVESQVLVPDLLRELREQAQLVVRLTEDNPDVWTHPDQAQSLVTRVNVGTSALLNLLDRDGRILASSDSPRAVGRILPHAGLNTVLAGNISEHTDYSPRLDGQVADILIPVFGPDHQVVGVVRMAHRLSTVYDQFLRLRYSVLAILGVALLLATLVGFILALTLERPLRQLAQGLDRLASGQELAALPLRGPEEIRLLLHAFNVLMERLRGMQESRRQLLANLVHELSTPLGALNSGVQALQDGADEDPQLRRDLLQGMNDEIRRLIRLLQDLTRMYDQVLGEVRLDRRQTALGEWLPGVFAVWREAALKKGLQCDATIAPDLPTLEIDPNRLAQVLGNLLNNAIKYTDRGGTVTLTAERVLDRVEIRVVDTGRGISRHELDRIFVPFYRGQHTGRFPDGMGLGLTIARQLAEAHGGQLHVASDVGKGSCFTLSLPL